jgi:hypothetical protein
VVKASVARAIVAVEIAPPFSHETGFGKTTLLPGNTSCDRGKLLVSKKQAAVRQATRAIQRLYNAAQPRVYTVQPRISTVRL